MPPKKPPTQGRWRALALSILLHSALVAAAVYGWFTWKHRAPDVDTLAIQGTVVDERVLKDIATKPEPPPEEPAPQPEPVPEPEPEPEPAPVEEQGPPAPDPEELKRKEEERLALEQKQKEEAEQKAAQELKEREEAERVEAEKQAAAKAAAEKAAREKAAAEKKAAEEKARLARQAELLKSLEAEERGNAARNSSEASQWRAQIAAKIQRNWKMPPTAVAGVECNVTVVQVPGGDVSEVRGAQCNVDDAVLRQSLENAVMAASPLPPPPAGVPFERILELTFKPQ